MIPSLNRNPSPAPGSGSRCSWPSCCSFGDRANTAGVQGTFLSRAVGPLTAGLGYRAGVITGYDERFIPLAGKTPVLPLAQPLLTLDGRPLGVELSYSGVSASAGLNLRF